MTTEIETAIAKLTTKGRETMEAIGNRKLSFFDDGVVEDSGIWGECIVGEMGHKSSGVVNGLVKQGLMTSSDGYESDNSKWYALTALGADVANALADKPEVPEVPVPAPVNYGPNAAKNFAQMIAQAVSVAAVAFWTRKLESLPA